MSEKSVYDEYEVGDTIVSLDGKMVIEIGEARDFGGGLGFKGTELMPKIEYRGHFSGSPMGTDYFCFFVNFADGWHWRSNGKGSTGSTTVIERIDNGRMIMRIVGHVSYENGYGGDHKPFCLVFGVVPDAIVIRKGIAKRVTSSLRDKSLEYFDIQKYKNLGC